MDTNEREAVRTTIVGGRPPGSRRNNMAVPRGIEVLVKKASVDPEFREVLLEQRGGAAKRIALALEPAEEAVLNTIPREQLVGIIGCTVVPVEQRRAFLGQVAIAMLAAVAAGVVGCSPEPASPPHVQTLGNQPDKPTQSPPPQLDILWDPQRTPRWTNYPTETLGIRPDRL